MKNKKIIIISVCIVLLIAIVTAVILLLPKDKKTNEEKTEEPKKVEEVVITFDTDGGKEIESIKVEKGKTIDLPTPKKDGFSFLGWYNGEVLVKGDEVYNTDTTLKAKWEEVKVEPVEEKKTFTISFNTNGGNKVSSIKVECGKTLGTLPTPKKDGYTFVSWADKNGKVILKGAKLSCENVTLYANWEKSEKPEQLPPPNQNIEPEPIPSKTYTCPDGYKLEGTKCTITTSAKEKCPSDTKVDGSLCIKTSDSNNGERVCKEYTVSIDGKGHTWTGSGDYYFIPNAYGNCAYYKWESYKTQSQCEQAYDINHKTKWVSYLNGCYAETKMNNYETVCSSDYQLYSSAELSSKFGIHDNAKCLKKISKEKYCDSGYTLSGNNCIKTIDATLK